jgi:hypothetical protein
VNPRPHARQNSGKTSTYTGETPPPDASFSQLPVAESSYNSTTAIPRICKCDNCAETERGNELRSRLPLEQCGPVESPMISQLRRRHLQSENYQRLIHKYRDFCWQTIDDIFSLLEWLHLTTSPSDSLLQTLRMIQETHSTFLMENMTSLKYLQATRPPIHISMQQDSEDMEYPRFIDLLNIS